MDRRTLAIQFVDLQVMDGVVDPDVHLLTGTPVTHPLFGSGGRNNSYDIAVFVLDDVVTAVVASLPEVVGTGHSCGTR